MVFLDYNTKNPIKIYLLILVVSFFGDIANYFALFLLNPKHRLNGFLVLIFLNIFSVVILYINQFIKSNFLAYLSMILNVSLRFVFPAASFWLINVVGFSNKLLLFLSLTYLTPFLILLVVRKRKKIVSFFNSKSFYIISFLFILILLPSRWQLRLFDLSVFEKNILLLRAIVGTFLITLCWDLIIFPQVIEVVENLDKK